MPEKTKDKKYTSMLQDAFGFAKPTNSMNKTLDEIASEFLMFLDENSDGVLDTKELFDYEASLYELVYEDILTYGDPEQKLIELYAVDDAPSVPQSFFMTIVQDLSKNETASIF